MKPAIVGISGPALTAPEAAMLRRHAPAGAILFARNVADPAQLGALTTALRDALPCGAVLMVDQEGGRVARLRPPHWRAHPPAAAIGALHGRDETAGLRAAWITGALIGLDCRAAGFDVTCAPVLDLRHPGAHDVVGDRSFGADPEAVAALGRALADGLLAAGVQPVGKHAPGHGRARADSHLELPKVAERDLDDDLLPFARNTDLPWMMTAHILFEHLDAGRCATLSPEVIGRIIRGRIGFAGLLVSDDLAMRALSGAPADLACAALDAGCDIALHCSGQMVETDALLASCPEMTPDALARLAAARSLASRRRLPLNGEALAAERDRLLS